MTNLQSALEAMPLTPFGRRALVRFALLSRDGRVGVRDLAYALQIREKTVWKMLKNTEPGWYEQADWLDAATRLCRLLKVDHTWLYDVTDYGEMGKINFDLRRREIYR